MLKFAWHWYSEATIIKNKIHVTTSNINKATFTITYNLIEL